MMPSLTLLAATVFLLIAAIVYAHVGDRILRVLEARGEASRARNLFALWWYGIALTTLANAVPTFAAALGFDAPGFHAAMQVVTMGLLSGALCGLVYYLLFVFTGRSRLLVPLVLVYASLATLSAYYVAAGNVTGVDIGRWQARLEYANAPPPALRLLLFALIALPQLAGAFAYATLLRKTQAPAQRYRVALVSVGIAVWSLCTLVLGAGALPDTDGPQLALRATMLSGILLVLAAYRPPAWVRRRLDARAHAA